MIQLDLFKTEQECELEELRKEVIRLRVSTDKVRKGMYARLNNIEKMYVEVCNEFEQWKKVLCSKKLEHF
jgi:hypothetical protein